MYPMRRSSAIRLAVRYAVSVWALLGLAVPALSGAISVAPDTPAPNRWTITGPAYTMVINLDSPRIESFAAGGYTLVQEGLGFAPTINTGAPWGPAKAAVALASETLTHVVMYGMGWEDALSGEIEIHYFCYPDRVVARLDIIPRAAPPTLLLGWYGAVTQAAMLPDAADAIDWHAVFGVGEMLAPAAVLLRPIQKGPERERGAHIRIERGKTVYAHYVYNAHDIGIRRNACTLLAANDEPSLLAGLSRESARRSIDCSATNGRYLGYDQQSGLHRFIKQPGADPMSITLPSAKDAGIDQLVAAVSAQSQKPVRIDGAAAPVAVEWLPRTFQVPPANGPGAYVFRIDLSDAPMTVTVKPMAASADGG